MAAQPDRPLERASPASRAADRPLVVLVGRPNAGKSSVFNALTGGHAHVGNFPGVTVDVLEGELALGEGTAEVVDLPGLYSIEAVVDRGTDEAVAREFLERAAASGRPMLVVQVIDATRLSLGLRLTSELRRHDWPLLVVATQRDVLENEGRTLDVAELGVALGAPAIAVCARSPEAGPQVRDAIARALGAPSPTDRRSFSPDELATRVVRDSGIVSGVAQRRRRATERADALLLHPALGPVLFLGLMAAAFAAVFLVADPASALIDALNAAARGRIESALGEGLVTSFLSDGLLGGAGTVVAFMPQIVILTVVMEVLESTGYLARGAFLVDRLLRLMGLSGRSFLPLLMGHACAVPAISSTRIIRDPHERLTAILVLPLMTCSARIPTYALVIGTFFAGRSALLKGGIFVSLYLAGIVSGLVASLVLRRTVAKGRSLPLVLEMPAYRMPQLHVIGRQALRAAWRFLRDVGTTIVAVSAVLWLLLTVPSPFASSPHAVREMTPASAIAPGVASSAAVALDQAPTQGPAAAVPREPPPIERSIAAGVGRALEPITRPLGFDWRINVGLIGSFGARELMVSTLGVIFGLEDAGNHPAPLTEKLHAARRPDGAPLYDTSAALALLAFFVLACQCMSTIAAIRRETRTWRWPIFVLGYTYALAYGAALVVHGIASLLA